MGEACKGSGRAPTEVAMVGHAKWGRCPRCRQWRPLYVGGNVKAHKVIAGLTPPPAADVQPEQVETEGVSQ